LITLRIHRRTIAKLTKELSGAKLREIGGVLVGEHVGRNEFRLVDLSIQRSGGNRTCFVRHPSAHKPFLDAFFKRADAEYERYNYLGEWHSHPGFPVNPSETDVSQMQKIVSEGKSGPLFAVLLIVQLSENDDIRLSATAHRAGKAPAAVTIQISDDDVSDAVVVEPWWRRIFMDPEPKRRRYRKI
jgi:proteasome lid subunit RPN8/RPN11